MGRRFRLLFVCTGNTCRSPLAEAWARRELAKPGLTNVAVSSAGTHACPDSVVSDNARVVARKLGLRLGRRRARPLTRLRVARADLILTMTDSQVEEVAARWPAASGKTFTLSGFAGTHTGEVADPAGRPERAYMDCAIALKHEVARALPRIRRALKARRSI